VGKPLTDMTRRCEIRAANGAATTETTAIKHILRDFYFATVAELIFLFYMFTLRESPM